MRHCCEDMTYMVEEEKSIVFVAKDKMYGVSIRNGGSSFPVMKYCPWCGKEL